MSDSLDCELIALINRLSKIQKEIGGGKKDKSGHELGGYFRYSNYERLVPQIYYQVIENKAL